MGKNLPYKGSPSARTKPNLLEVEDTEDNNGERGTYMIRTKSDLSVRGDVIGGSIHNGKGAIVDFGADYSEDGGFGGRSKRRTKGRKKCQRKCQSKCPLKYQKKCQKKCQSKFQSKCRSKCWSKCCLE